jgi:N6-adenosine-specific RNA methylase IME4/ParB-like chromosome segregation protein Spo0J
MKVHPAAEIFPLLTGGEFDSLVTDIRANGLREAIWLDRDKRILDGRNRHRACKEANVEPRFRTHKGADAVAFVISLNLHRRHLNESQRAMSAARLADMPQGARTDLSKNGATSQADAAALLNVSRHSVQNATKVLADGAIEVVAAVDSGTVTVTDAAAIAGESRPTQRACLKMVTAGKTDTLKAAQRKRDIDRQRRDIAAGRVTLPVGVFEIIVIDPPWPNEGNYSPGHYMSRAASPYPEMSLEELANVDIPAAPDCILWCWATNRFLHDAFHLLEAWEFDYKTVLTWHKQRPRAEGFLRLGLGNWLRNNTEHCLVATKGRPKWLIDLTSQSTILEAQAREHSRKPDAFYHLVDSLCVGRKLDCYSREKRPGWEQSGNDVAKFGDVA